MRPAARSNARGLTASDDRSQYLQPATRWWRRSENQHRADPLPVVNTHYRDHHPGNAFFAKQGAVILRAKREGMVGLSKAMPAAIGGNRRLPRHHYGMGAPVKSA
jgi:hypothetical protein